MKLSGYEKKVMTYIARHDFEFTEQELTALAVNTGVPALDTSNIIRGLERKGMATVQPVRQAYWVKGIREAQYEVFQRVGRSEEGLVYWRDVYPMRELLTTDSETGFDDLYSPIEGVYFGTDTKTNDDLDEEETIEVDYTASISTDGGHEPFAAEITGVIVLRKRNKKYLGDMEGEIQRRVKDYIKDYFDAGKGEKKPVGPEGFLHNKIVGNPAVGGIIIKEGIEYKLVKEKGEKPLDIVVEKGGERKRLGVTYHKKEKVK